MKQQITACIDGSAIAPSVCDTAAWAGRQLGAPIRFLHVLERPDTPAREDWSGAIGLGSREHLLEELTELDERRNRLAIEHGKHILEDAAARAADAGATDISTEQRHDQLLDALLECEAQTRLYVVGRLGEDHEIRRQVIGSHIESVVRAIHTPILMATGSFSVPSNYMLAYDGSETADQAIERIGSSPLLRDLPGHIVMVGENSEDNRARLERGRALLADRGHALEAHLVQGPVIEALMDFQARFDIQLKVMGAYGHSRFREFFLGSNTTRMLASTSVPVLILR